ncbi:MAG: methyltransferase domain-containing protein, partial [Campylobacterota bacterium]|nr:methyltransferase domain-containing protein [Campylobacterota bacterium]
MKFSNKDKEYLSGECFSSGYNIKLSGFNTSTTRLEYLINKVKNKNILHIGFVDHLPVIDEKIKLKKWLHDDIDHFSKYCLGVDINLEGVNYIQDKYPKYDVAYLDIMDNNIPQQIKEIKWDYIILPDVIEHINFPVDFLKSIKENYSKYCETLIITTPNATRYRNIKEVFNNTELINTDHRFWFTPYTLGKIVTDSGCTIESFELMEYGKLPLYINSNPKEKIRVVASKSHLSQETQEFIDALDTKNIEQV